MVSFPRGYRLAARVVLLVVLLAAIQFGAAQYIEWTVIRSGEAVVGAKVDVGSSHMSLVNGCVTLDDLRVANPHAPLCNLLSADRAEFALDLEALLHKRAVVRQGKIEGLQFATPRATSGHLPGSAAQAEAILPGSLDLETARLAHDWLDQLEAGFRQDLTDQLKSVRLTEELLARWPGQYAAVENRLGQLHDRAVELQAEVRQAQTNPLRHAAFLESLPARVAQLRDDCRALHREVESLPDLADADRRAIVAARHHDEELLAGKLKFDKIDDTALSAYLMQQRLAGPVGDFVGWIRLIRQIVPAEPRFREPVHGRGEDVLFVGCEPAPELSIRRLDLRGKAAFGNHSLGFVGSIHNYSSDPARGERPLKLQLKSEGAIPLELCATLDRTGAVMRDEFTLECHGAELPEALLGSSEKLRLLLLPTRASLVARVVVEGDRVSGDINLVERQARLTSRVSGELARLPMAMTLDRSLASVDTITTCVTLRGTLEKPKWQIESSLGPALAKAAGEAVQEAARHHAAEIVARSERSVDERLAGLDRQIAQEQAALEPQLAESTGLVNEIAGDHEPDKRLDYEQLGNRLPAGSLFR